MINKFNEPALNDRQSTGIPKHLYLAEVEKEFIRIHSPREGKKLVVLDIDSTICDFDSLDLRYAARPFLIIFLRGIYKYFDIGIWSATDMDIVEEKMNVLGLSNDPKYKILFYMSQAAMVVATLDNNYILVSRYRSLLL